MGRRRRVGARETGQKESMMKRFAGVAVATAIVVVIAWYALPAGLEAG